MTGSPEVIQTLQAAMAAESHLNQQYRLDRQQLKFIGVKKPAATIKKFGDDTHDWLRAVTNRVLFLGGATSYQSAPVVDQENVTSLLKNELALEMAIVQPYEEAVQIAMKALDDTTRNLFEHLLKWHQKHVAWLEQQLRLINAIGEQEYIAEQI
jgi:bacterioferritin